MGEKHPGIPGGHSPPWAEGDAFGAEEVADDGRSCRVIRAYLDRWHWQVSSQVGVPKDATDDQLRQIAPNHPVFRLLQAQAFVNPAESA